jgi:hypothetical protein
MPTKTRTKRTLPALSLGNTTQELECPAQPLSIDEWFSQQDRDIDEAFKILKRNKRRRKIDHGEMERRIAIKVALEQEQCAVEIAIARAVYARFGLATITEANRSWKPELVEALKRRSPKVAFNDYPINSRACKTEERKYSSREDGQPGSEHYWEVRCEVVAEMRAEREEEERQRALQGLPRRLHPDAVEHAPISSAGKTN